MDKKNVQDAKVTINPDEKEKIVSIQDSIRKLIEAKGYNNITIQDIAESASVQYFTNWIEKSFSTRCEIT